MGSEPLHLWATQHPLAGHAGTTVGLAPGSVGDNPHGVFPCRSPVAAGTSSQRHRLPPQISHRSRSRRFRQLMTPAGQKQANIIRTLWRVSRTTISNANSRFGSVSSESRNNTPHTRALVSPRRFFIFGTTC